MSDFEEEKKKFLGCLSLEYKEVTTNIIDEMILCKKSHAFSEIIHTVEHKTMKKYTDGEDKDYYPLKDRGKNFVSKLKCCYPFISNFDL